MTLFVWLLLEPLSGFDPAGYLRCFGWLLQDICGALVCNVQSVDPNSNHLIIWMKEMVASANVTRDELVSYARRWFCKVLSETMIGMVCVTRCDDRMPIWERKKP